jgi:hypothetical protein
MLREPVSEEDGASSQSSIILGRNMALISR